MKKLMISRGKNLLNFTHLKASEFKTRDLTLKL